MSLTELLFASAILLALTGAVGDAVMRAQRTFRVQPELADLQQRLRAATTMLARDLTMAGAGPSTTTLAGSLAQRFPPVAPYRRGQVDEGAAVGFYRPDVVSVVYVPDTRAEANVLGVTDLGAELLVDAAPNCGVLVHERLCGFTVDMRVALLDARGSFDLATVTDVTGDRVRVAYAGPLRGAYGRGAVIAEVVAPTYALRTDAATGAFQLVRYDGFRTERAVADNVVEFRVEYFGDPAPPRVLASPAPADPVRPATTYGPLPPAAGVDDRDDTWAAGENCVFADAGGPVSRLARLGADASPVPLPPAMLQDGPWCPDPTRTGRYDADLLRIRRVRIRLRMQVAVAAFRGPAGRLFRRGGLSSAGESFAPDQQMVVDVTPRNLGVAP